MPATGAYGHNLASRFRLPEAPAFVTRTLPAAEIAVTEIRCDRVNNGISAPIPREDALLLTLQLRDCPAHDLWVDGEPQATRALPAGAHSIYDLRLSPVVNSISPFHNLHFYMTRRALDMIADDDGVPPVGEVGLSPGDGVIDPVVQGLGFSLLPAFERPNEANLLFVSHVSLAIAAYLVRAGATRPVGRVVRDLSDVQEHQAKEFIDENLHGRMSISAVAEACGFPPGDFSDAFHRKVGMAPHRWLLERRLDRAVGLLARPGAGLADVAAQCGFADQAHLRRALQRATRH